MYRDKRFDLASDHTGIMKVAYSRAEIESKDNICYGQNRNQDSNRETNQESSGDNDPGEKHGEDGPRTIHRAHPFRRNGFQTRLVDLQSQHWDYF